jgi:preprotein translocase subunit SecF
MIDLFIMFLFGFVCGVLSTILFAAWYVSSKDKR